MTIERDLDFGGHTLTCDICHSMFSSEEGETPKQIEQGMAMCGWAVRDDEHACFSCTGRDPQKDWSNDPAKWPEAPAL